MASTCLFAAKKAIEAARSELGKSAQHFQLGMLLSIELFLQFLIFKLFELIAFLPSICIEAKDI